MILLPLLVSLGLATTSASSARLDRSTVAPELRAAVATGIEDEIDPKGPEAIRRARQAAVDLGGDSWKAIEVGRLFVVTQADESHAKRVAQQSEAMLAWLDDFLPTVGPGTVVRPPILRIFSSWEAEESFRETHGGETPDGWEIITHKDEGGTSGYEFSWLNRELLEHWLFDRDPDLHGAMPAWMWDGLRRYVEAGRFKNRKLSFRRDADDRDDIRVLSREGRLDRLKDLVRTSFEDWTPEELDEEEDEFDASERREIEAGSFVDYLLSKEGAREKRTKKLLESYVECLQAVIEKRRDAVHATAKTLAEEEPEDDWVETDYLIEAWSRVDGETVMEAFDCTFGAWKEKDWEALETRYLKAIR